MTAKQMSRGHSRSIGDSTVWGLWDSVIMAETPGSMARFKQRNSTLAAK